MRVLEWIGRWLARHLSKPRGGVLSIATSNKAQISAALRKGDVLLVEGTSRFSDAIKYLTQSTWSHATLYIGETHGPPQDKAEKQMLLEADIIDGVRTVPLSAYCDQHVRICRPVGLSRQEIDSVVDYAVARLGYQYDLKNIIDLIRYLVQAPPVPSRYRRRMIALGSGDPTRAICSSLIAQAFQSVRYPILPEVIAQEAQDNNGLAHAREMVHIRHHSLFAPRDFDISPYFEVIKPTLDCGFDPKTLNWDRSGEEHRPDREDFRPNDRQ